LRAAALRQMENDTPELVRSQWIAQSFAPQYPWIVLLKQFLKAFRIGRQKPLGDEFLAQKPLTRGSSGERDPRPPSHSALRILRLAALLIRLVNTRREN
jgi:hypothetical protein